LYIADLNNDRVRKVATNGTMTTIAGGGSTAPAAGVTATSASFGRIAGVAVDPVTNEVYFTDYDNHQVWKIPQTVGVPSQLVLIAGTGTNGYNGDQADATQAQLYNPAHLFLQGNTLSIADSNNGRIRQVTTNLTPQPLMTVAGTTSQGFNGDGNAAIVSQLSTPYGMAADAAGDLYIADQNNHRVREVLASDHTLQTAIGNGAAGLAGDGGSGRGITVTASVATGGINDLPVTVGVAVQQSQWQIVSISGPIGGTSQTTNSSFTFNARTTNNDRMAADTAVTAVSTVPSVFSIQTSPLTMPVNTQTMTFTALTQMMGGSGQLQISANGTTFLASSLSSVITVLPPATPVLTISDAFGPVTTATGVRQNYYVRLPSTASGSPVSVNLTSSDGSRVGLALCDATNSQNSSCTGTTAGTGITVSIPAGSNFGYFDLVGLTSANPDTRLNSPTDVAVDGSGAVYVADYSNFRVRKLSGGVLTTIAGSGSSTPLLGANALATGMRPIGLTVDSGGNVYVASDNGHVVYQVTPSGGISIIAGAQNTCTFADGALGANRLCRPSQVAIGADGSLYIADLNNDRVRKVAANGTMTTIAGGGSTAPAAGVTATSASFGRIAGVAVDQVTNEVYFTDYDNAQVWKIAQTVGVPSQLVLIAGTGTAGYNGDQADATQAQLFNPAHLFLQGNKLSIADSSNGRIRQVTTNLTPQPLMTVAGTTSQGFNGDGNAAIVSQLYTPYGMAADAAGDLYIADQNNHRIREVLAEDGTLQTVIGNGTGGFTGDGLPGRGPTITATIAPGTGAPNYLPVTVGVDIEQSTWQFVSFPSTTTGPGLGFTVRQTSNAGTAMRMNQATTFSVTPLAANVFSLPATLTIPNNGTSVSPATFSISSISRSGNAVTVTSASTVAGVLTSGEIVGISGVTNASFNGVFTITSVGTGATFTYAQTGSNAASTGGTVSTSATIGSGTTQIIAQASTTGIASAASTNITVTPVLGSVGPVSGTHGTTIPVTITGQNLLGVTGITGPTGITVNSLANFAPDGSSFTANIVLASGAPTGIQTLTINTATGTVNFAFTVN
jgi:hypothetical protein